MNFWRTDVDERISKDSRPAPAGDRRRQAEQRCATGSPRPSTAWPKLRSCDAPRTSGPPDRTGNAERGTARAERTWKSFRTSTATFSISPRWATFVWDEQGRVLDVNLAGAAMLGLDQRAIVNRRLEQFVATEQRAALAEFCKLVLATDARSRPANSDSAATSSRCDASREGSLGSGTRGTVRCTFLRPTSPVASGLSRRLMRAVSGWAELLVRRWTPLSAPDSRQPHCALQCGRGEHVRLPGSGSDRPALGAVHS